MDSVELDRKYAEPVWFSGSLLLSDTHWVNMNHFHKALARQQTGLQCAYGCTNALWIDLKIQCWLTIMMFQIISRMFSFMLESNYHQKKCTILSENRKLQPLLHSLRGKGLLFANWYKNLLMTVFPLFNSLWVPY